MNERFLALTALLLFAATLAADGPALAEASPGSGRDFARPGWYAGVGIFYALSDYELSTSDLGVVPEQPPNVDPEFGNALGVDARAGYRAFDRWAFELDYQWQSGYDSDSALLTHDLEIDTHLLSLNTKFFLMTDRVQPYGLLGVSLLIFNTEIVDDAFRKPWDIDVGFAPRFGAGVDYYLNDHWVLNLEGTYIVPVGNLDGANMGSVGLNLLYRF